jgi:acetyl-CoA synthetase
VTYRFDFLDYDSAQRSFTIPVPEYFNFGFDVIDRHAEDENKRALVWTDASGSVVKKYTFRDISRLSNQAANALRGIGIKKGDRVFIMLGRIPEWYCILVACHKLGAVIMPAPVILASSDIEYRIAKGRANVVITSTARQGGRGNAQHRLARSASQAPGGRRCPGVARF